MVVAVAAWAMALRVLWGSMLPAASDGAIGRSLKHFYLFDQMSVLSVASNVARGRAAYVDPFTETGASIYPSGYYWLLGKIAAGFDVTVIAAWNVVGLGVSVLLLAIATAWALWARPGSRAWAIAPLPVLVGTLGWWFTGEWLYSPGDGVLWPTAATLYSPGAENPALVLLFLGLLALAAALAGGGRRRIALAAGGGAAIGAILHVHAYVAAFAALAVVIMLLAEHALVARPRWRIAVGGGVVVALLAMAVGQDGGFAGRIGILVLLGVVALVVDPAWRRRLGAPALAGAVAATVVASPMLWRIGRQLAEPDSFYYARQESVNAAGGVSLPVSQVALYLLPIWLLAAAALYGLAHEARRSPRARAWFGALAGVLGAVLLLTFNRAWGVQGIEAYRFVPYGTFLLTALAAPWLWTAIGGQQRWSVRAPALAIAVALAMCVPSVWAFTHDQDNAVRRFLPAELAATSRLADALGADPLVVVDTCIPAEEFKVLSGLRVVAVNRGLALPARIDAVDAVLRIVSPTDAAQVAANAAGSPTERATRFADSLHQAHVTDFVTHSACAGVDPGVVRGALGEPVLRVPIDSPGQFGLPPDAAYEVFAVPPADAVASRGTAPESSSEANG